MAGDAFEYEDEERGIGTGGFGSGGKVSYASTGGTTPRGSRGFVNVGQLLRLNRQSGQESARALSSGIGNQAQGAVDQVKGAEKSFMDQSNKASNQLGPGSKEVDYRKASIAEGYGGPKTIDETEGVDMGKIRQNVQKAQEGLSNLGTADGRATLASQAQGGLGARQAAAASFYMGSSNPIFGQTTSKFGNLNKMLSESAKRASDYGAGGQGRVDANRQLGLDRISQMDSARSNLEDATEKARRNQMESDYLAQRRASNKSGGVSGRTNMSETEMASTLGMSYQEWLAAGKPYGEDHPGYQAWLAKRRTGGM